MMLKYISRHKSERHKYMSVSVLWPLTICLRFSYEFAYSQSHMQHTSYRAHMCCTKINYPFPQCHSKLEIPRIPAISPVSDLI